MSKHAKLELDGKSYTLPVVVGTEDEHAVDVSALRADTGYITLDEGYGNTGACKSKITFIDGEKGILRYRGISIEELAEKSSFVESRVMPHETPENWKPAGMWSCMVIVRGQGSV